MYQKINKRDSFQKDLGNIVLQISHSAIWFILWPSLPPKSVLLVGIPEQGEILLTQVAATEDVSQRLTLTEHLLPWAAEAAVMSKVTGGKS